MSNGRTAVVVGAGPTGVEMAGVISELARFTLRKDFRNIDPAKARVILVEAGPRVLPTFAPKVSENALKQLHHLKVEVLLNSAVTRLAEGEVDINKEAISTRTVVWAAGNKASPLAGLLGVLDGAIAAFERNMSAAWSETVRSGKPSPGSSSCRRRASANGSPPNCMMVWARICCW